MSDETFITNPPAVLSTEVVEIYESSEVDEVLHETYENLQTEIDGFQDRQSGWVLDRLRNMKFK